MNAILFEHEQDLELLLSYLLEKAGFTVEIAQTKDSLISQVVRSSPALILLGNCPPYLSQASVLDQLRPVLREDKSYLLILSTSKVFQEEVNREQHPSISCIKTPVSPGKLNKVFLHLRDSLSGSHEGDPDGHDHTSTASG